MIFKDEAANENIDIEDKIKLLQNKGFSAKDISVILSELYGINKNILYKVRVGK